MIGTITTRTLKVLAVAVFAWAACVAAFDRTIPQQPFNSILRRQPAIPLHIRVMNTDLPFDSFSSALLLCHLLLLLCSPVREQQYSTDMVRDAGWILVRKALTLPIDRAEVQGPELHTY